MAMLVRTQARKRLRFRLARCSGRLLVVGDIGVGHVKARKCVATAMMRPRFL